MKRDLILKQITDGLESLDNQIRKYIAIYSDKNDDMRENLNSMQDSIVCIDNYINIIKKKIEDEENIFFLGVGDNKNQSILEEQEKNKADIIDNINKLKEMISMEEDKKNFFERISSDLIEYNKMISYLIDDKDCKKKSIVDKLKICQKFAKIDHERCYIEIGKVIKEVEQWEEE